MLMPPGEATVISEDTAEEPSMADLDLAADPEAPMEVVQERYPSGKVKIRREVTLDQLGNYVAHGEWNMWDEAGNLIATGQYRNGERQGTWTRLHQPGDSELFSEVPYKEFRPPFTSRATFENGKLHGKWTISDSEQRTISEFEYINGLLHGLSIWNYASGQLMREVVFRDGLVDGYLHQYDRTGQLTIDETYQQGRKLAPKIEHDKAGRKQSEGIYLHAQFAIESMDDWWNARPVKYAPVGRDVKHGCWTAWYPNGQKRTEGIYEHDLPEGQFTWWFQNGQQAVNGNFRKGKPHGVWTWWHENGQKATSGQYTDGEPSGAWIYWQEDGQLAEKTDFSAATDSVVLEPKELKMELQEPKLQPPAPTMQSQAPRTHSPAHKMQPSAPRNGRYQAQAPRQPAARPRTR
jgi:antitoxin component YwqK of YwqJK toxin-antitoxin module